MRAGETWTGVYFHSIYGYLHLIEQGESVVGKWQRTDKSAWGQLIGKRTGNVLHFDWVEQKSGNASSRGRGVFIYQMGKENIAELDGRFGLNQDETGNDWHCVKQRNVTPDLGSIAGPNPSAASTKPTYDVACEKQPSESDVDAAKASFFQGRDASERGDHAKAATCFDEAYRRDCTKPALLLSAAKAHEMSGAKTSAIAALEAYVKRAPAAPDIESVKQRLKILKGP